MKTSPDAPEILHHRHQAPAYRTVDPQLWFLQVLIQFTTRRITAELARYHHVVASLPQVKASEIGELLLTLPAKNAYRTLKQLLISRLTPSEPQLLHQLLHDTELGKQTPSQLWRHMRQLLHTAGQGSGRPFTESFERRYAQTTGLFSRFGNHSKYSLEQ
ncbi:hypothetical protein MRX96_049999 [Rhipicephalus microplus]